MDLVVSVQAITSGVSAALWKSSLASLSLFTVVLSNGAGSISGESRQASVVCKAGIVDPVATVSLSDTFGVLATSRQGGLTEGVSVSSVLVEILTNGASLDLVETIGTGKVASTQVIQQVAAICTSRASRILASIGQSGGTDTSGGVEVCSSCALGSGVESTVTCVVLRAEVVDKEHSITLVTSWVLATIRHCCLALLRNQVEVSPIGA